MPYTFLNPINTHAHTHTQKKKKKKKSLEIFLKIFEIAQLPTLKIKNSDYQGVKVGTNDEK